MARSTAIVPSTLISRKIYFLRDTRIMIDADLAALYRVTTSNLNKAVRRNPGRFPSDFMFRLKAKEARALTFQSGISNAPARGGRRYLPYAFTEQGVAMLSSVLHSKRAVVVNIAIMRALCNCAAPSRRTMNYARKSSRWSAKFEIVFSAIKQMLEPPATPKPSIGFHAPLRHPPTLKSLNRHTVTT